MSRTWRSDEEYWVWLGFSIEEGNPEKPHKRDVFLPSIATVFVMGPAFLGLSGRLHLCACVWVVLLPALLLLGAGLASGISMALGHRVADRRLQEWRAEKPGP